MLLVRGADAGGLDRASPVGSLLAEGAVTGRRQSSWCPGPSSGPPSPPPLPPLPPS
jgi:hypothetical protein